jgi:hypothetical protein
MGPVSEWSHIFGHERPKVASLFGLPTGGSHLVLHKMHGHPHVLGLKQRALYPQLKHYFGEGSYLMQELLELQLRPKKESLCDVKWLVVNKPQMAFVSNQFLFNREKIANFYCLRNPIALFYSRAKGRKDFGRKVYQRELSWQEIAASIVDEYRISLAAFAQVYSQERDLALNLESFASQMEDYLAAIWKLMGLEFLSNHELAELKDCDLCGRPLKSTKGDVGGRTEEILYCAHDDLFFTGPGGYNYIRKFDLSNLSSWKNKEQSKELEEYFSSELGEDLIAFFADERYLDEDARSIFDQIFQNILYGFRGWQS